MSKSWKTRLIHSDAKIPPGYRSLASPTFRGSTTLFPSASVVNDSWDQWRVGYTYGLYGTPTVLELAARVCELESGYRTILTPGGQAAISLINFALLETGDHILVPASVYYPNRKLATRLLSRFGVSTDFYDPSIGAGISSIPSAWRRLPLLRRRPPPHIRITARSSRRAFSVWARPEPVQEAAPSEISATSVRSCSAISRAYSGSLARAQS